MSARNARPTTPSLKLAGGGPSGAGPVGAAMDPASPPQTPTSASPLLNHDKSGVAVGHIPLYQNFARPSVRQGSNIRPVGTGHQFSYTRGPNTNRFAQLSPQSSSEEDEEEEEEEEDDEEASSDSGSTSSRLPRSLDDDDEDVVIEGREDERRRLFASARPPSGNIGHSSGEEEEDDEDDEEDDDESKEEDEEEVVRLPRAPRPPASTASSHTAAVVASFVVEELSDYDPMNDNRSDIMRPTGIESPNSHRARSLSRGAATDSDTQSHHEPTPPRTHQVHLTHRPRPAPHPDDADLGRIPELDRGMSNLNCTPTPEAEDDDEEGDDIYDVDAAALADFAAAQREIRMRKRRSHGSSIGKRTHSERSDSDGEKDWTPLGDDVDMVGGSARRLRRRVGDRRSLLSFQDPPPECIEELDEPDSCAEDGWPAANAATTRGLGGIFDGENLARELPYYDLEIMEVDDE